MIAQVRTISASFWLFAFGIFTCTWDTLFTLEMGGFNLRIHQLFFALSFLSLFWERRPQGLEAFLSPLSAPFARCMLALAALQIGLSPWSAFPLKSFLYSCWLTFSLGAIWLTAQHLGRTVPKAYFFQVVWITIVFLSIVILVDQVAYQFGAVGGLIGHNQDVILKWGVSRPHAFSFEPSYIASFLSLGLIATAVPVFHLAKRKWFFWLGFFGILFAGIATTSRTGWISLCLGGGFLLALPLFFGRRIQWKLFGVVFGILVAVTTLFYATTPPQQREAMFRALSNFTYSSSSGARLRSHMIAYEMAKETRWIGTGFGASYRYYMDRGGNDELGSTVFAQKHYGNEIIMSTWGQLLAEGGILSALLFGAAGFFLLRALYIRCKDEKNGFTLGALSATLIFFGFIAFSLGNVCRSDVWVWYALWSVLAAQKAEPVPDHAFRL